MRTPPVPLAVRRVPVPSSQPPPEPLGALEREDSDPFMRDEESRLEIAPYDLDLHSDEGEDSQVLPGSGLF